MIKMTKFNVNITDVDVAEWNSEFEDWSGNSYSKEGFSLGFAKSNSFNDVMDVIKDYFDIDERDVFLNDFNMIEFSIIEDVDGIEDSNGNYLVSYLLDVEKIENVGIEK
ncbi:hypothetical protein vBSauClo6_149 [Staphylococcus phage vB_Sau_Clo6]|nr:hypothetical protein vBSauClo6_149 [Staphylococcus phage vB_Sau_Clo6]